jgi:hypothetical protein
MMDVKLTRVFTWIHMLVTVYDILGLRRVEVMKKIERRTRERFSVPKRVTGVTYIHEEFFRVNIDTIKGN